MAVATDVRTHESRPPPEGRAAGMVPGMDQLVLVLTMGRVGSSVVHHGLDAAVGVESVHIHNINADVLAYRSRLGPEKTARHVKQATAIRDRLEASDEPVKIVTLVRDVVERNMSAAFAAFRRHFPDDFAERVDDPEATGLIWRYHRGDLPLTWYDIEFGEGLGIDVYAEPFPETGHAQVASGRFDVLVMRSDLPNEEKSDLLSGFVGAPVSVRQGSPGTQPGGKWDTAYDRFRATAGLTDERLAEFGSSRFMQHFFAVDVDQYVASWRRRLDEAAALAS